MEIGILLARSSAVVGAALALAFACRRRSAALRHFVLVAGLATGALVVPLANVMPAWEVELWLAPAALEPERVTVATAVRALPGEGGLQDQGATPGRVLALRDVTVGIWLAGVALFGWPLAAGLIALRRLSRRAPDVPDERWQTARDEVAARLGVTRPVRLLRADHAVGTWGVLHPAIVVPADAASWDDDRVRAALMHELAHVARADWGVQLAADVLRVACWFNPLIWLAVRRLRDESERASDDAVLRAGVPDRAYATHLLAIAKSARGFAPARAMAMARPSTLEGRVAAMLNASVDRRVPSRRVRLATVALLLAVASAAAVRVAAQVAGPAALEGVVYDSGGAVLPAVELVLENDQGIRWSTQTDRSGHYEFTPVGAGQYVLEASLAGFKRFRQPVALQTAKDWKKAITLQVGELEETITVTARRPQRTAPPAAPGTSAAPVRVGGNIKVPRKVFDKHPVYPPAMQAASLEGQVKVEVLIGVDGAVVFARSVSAQVHPDFASSAEEAVKQWRFTPTLLNGNPVEVAMTVSVAFTLSD